MDVCDSARLLLALDVHQVLANVESEEEPGAIADVHRPGYEMAEKVLREAQVTVAKEE